jgi:hypothetical protein
MLSIVPTAVDDLLSTSDLAISWEGPVLAFFFGGILGRAEQKAELSSLFFGLFSPAG